MGSADRGNSEPVNPFQVVADEMEALEAECDRYREALQQIAATPSGEHAGVGRDRHYRLNGHKECVRIAKEALGR